MLYVFLLLLPQLLTGMKMNKNQSEYPVLFIGHGSPLNITADNSFTRDMATLKNLLPEPEAVLVISAHWLTKGTRITAGAFPGQIYDFYGFPEALYKVIYNAPGSPTIAKKIIESIGQDKIIPDTQRGIDHAAWAILKHIYPDHRIPVLELSLDIEKDPSQHFELGKKLAALRKMGILVIGSGNIVHNLYEVDFNEFAEPFPWALEFDNVIRSTLERGDFKKLIEYNLLGKNAMRAVPTSEHYLPMLYTAGMISENEKISFIHESVQNGSVSMRSFISA